MDAPENITAQGTRKPGRKKYEVTELRKTQVKMAIAGGQTVEQIAHVMNVQPSLIYKYFKEELRYRGEAITLATGHLFSLIQQKANLNVSLNAVIFYLKTQGGWRTKDALELSAAPVTGQKPVIPEWLRDDLRVLAEAQRALSPPTKTLDGSISHSSPSDDSMRM